MAYKSISLREEIQINNIVTIHYFEYMKDFSFIGESHNFWEFLYVDKGEVEVTADKREFALKAGEIVFHKPNEFHSLRANGVIAPNLVVISFICNSPGMRFFNNQILQINNDERDLLGQIIREAKATYSSQLDDPLLKQLEHKPETEIPFASEQVIKILLEFLLIKLIRRYSKENGDSSKELTKKKLLN